MTLYTPGPWNFYRSSGAVGDKNSKVVCYIPASVDEAKACANGTLIAAAPDLLAALEAIANFPITYPSENQDAANMAFIARGWVKKATDLSTDAKFAALRAALG